MNKFLILFTIFLVSCSTPSKLATINSIANQNKDVLILSTLIHEHLKQTNSRDFGLIELHKIDTLKRIATNFELIKLKAKGGYISVYYKFSKSRNEGKIELSDQEKEIITWNNWTEKQFDKNYDGEIRFDYGERFYKLKKIVVKRK